MHPRAGAQGALACDAEPVVKLRGVFLLFIRARDKPSLSLPGRWGAGQSPKPSQSR